MSEKNKKQDFAAGYTHEDLKSLNESSVAAGTSSWACAIRASWFLCPTTAATSACPKP